MYCKENGILEDQLSSKIRKYSLGNIKLRNSLGPLIRTLRKVKPDYIISGGDFPNIISVIASLCAGKTKCIISHHNYPNIEHKNNTLRNILIRYIYNRAYKVVSVSKGISEYLYSIGVKRHKVSTIYNPLDIKEIQSKSQIDLGIDINDEYLIYIGRLSPVKNLPMLIDAYSIVKQKYPELKLVIVGEGGDKDSIIQKIEEMHLTQDIILTGALSNPFPLMQSSRAVLLSSLSEALPTVILESFALGKKVVSTPTNGALDLLANGTYGYLSASVNSEIDFANAIFNALSSDFAEQTVKEYAMSFSSELKAKELCSLL